MLSINYRVLSCNRYPVRHGPTSRRVQAHAPNRVGSVVRDPARLGYVKNWAVVRSSSASQFLSKQTIDLSTPATLCMPGGHQQYWPSLLTLLIVIRRCVSQAVESIEFDNNDNLIRYDVGVSAGRHSLAGSRSRRSRPEPRPRSSAVVSRDRSVKAYRTGSDGHGLDGRGGAEIGRRKRSLVIVINMCNKLV